MKKNEDRELDNLFKNGLGEPEYQSGYLEDDWNALENMLDKSKKRRGLIFWLPVLSSAAAILIFFGWWFFTTPVLQQNQPKQQQSVFTTGQKKSVAAAKIADNQKSGDKIKSVTSSNEAKNLVVPQAGLTVTGGNKPKKELALNAGHNAGRNNANIKLNNRGNDNGAHEQYLQQTVKNEQSATIPGGVHTDAVTLTAVNSGLLTDDLIGANKRMVSTPVESKDINRNKYMPDPVKNEGGVTKLGFVKRPQLALAFIGASELNGANSLGDGRSGTNVGLMFSAGIFNKLTVSTGANYSVKPYNTNIANYHTNYTFKTNPSAIEADCRVLDIPVNLDYQLYNKHKNKFTVGTGLSSYIMLHESYNYYYADPTTKGPVAYTVAKPGKYFFGVMNLQATYQRQVNSKVGISIEPYMKLPLTNIGYSQVKLQTAGVAVGLNWNLNSLTKP